LQLPTRSRPEAGLVGGCVNEGRPPFGFSHMMESGRRAGEGQHIADPMEIISSRLAIACHSALLGKTLRQFGGVVQSITEADPPYRVLSVSDGWHHLTGFTRNDAIGRSLSFLQGAETETEAIATLMRAVKAENSVAVRLTNYTKSGRKFVHQLLVEPLRDPAGKTRCFQATSLVLQLPGQLLEELAPVKGYVPLISDQAVPPLWPLLGRSVVPEHESVPQMQPTPQHGPAPIEPIPHLPQPFPEEFEMDVLSWLQDDDEIQ